MPEISRFYGIIPTHWFSDKLEFRARGQCDARDESDSFHPAFNPVLRFSAAV